MNRSTKHLAALIILFVPAFPWGALSQTRPLHGTHAVNQINATEILDMIKTLASPRFAGRLTGSPQFRESAEYLAGRLKSWRVLPGVATGYLQPWPVAYTRIGTRSRFALMDGDSAMEYSLYRDYVPALFTATAKIEAPAVFAGYGITAPELDYDDYAGVDVRGKLALVVKGMPAPDVKRWSKYDDHAVRMENARRHGAAGAIYIYIALAVPKGVWQKDFPVVLVSRKVAEDLFAASGKDYAQIIKGIGDSGRPGSFPTGRTFRIETEGSHFPNAEGLNVIGYVEGSDPILRNEAVLIGAHFDGLGDRPELMPGAYDNASGTATMMQVAKAFARSPAKPRRSICFAGFGGEEMGKLGSQYYLAHPSSKFGRITAMINLDMTSVGDAIRVSGGELNPDLASYFLEAGKTLNRTLLQDRLTIPPNSDYGPFMENDIPVLGITSASTRGTSGPMRGHSPRDTVDQIKPEIAESIARLVFLGTFALANKQ